MIFLKQISETVFSGRAFVRSCPETLTGVVSDGRFPAYLSSSYVVATRPDECSFIITPVSRRRSESPSRPTGDVRESILEKGFYPKVRIFAAEILVFFSTRKPKESFRTQFIMKELKLQMFSPVPHLLMFVVNPVFFKALGCVLSVSES